MQQTYAKTPAYSATAPASSPPGVAFEAAFVVAVAEADPVFEAVTLVAEPGAERRIPLLEAANVDCCLSTFVTVAEDVMTALLESMVVVQVVHVRQTPSEPDQEEHHPPGPFGPARLPNQPSVDRRETTGVSKEKTSKN
jgi:hypothetical protein